MHLQPGSGWLALALLAPAGIAAEAAGPWDLDRLQQAPQVEHGSVEDRGGYTLEKIFFHNEDYQGHATRMFAYLAAPKTGEARAPGIVLIHGGAGKAFPEWAAQWAEYGYVALAIDLNGRDDGGQHLADGGPIMGEATLIADTGKVPLRDLWPYHGVAAAIRGVSLLRADPRVDPARIGMMGPSWGGYTVCIAASLDARLAFAIPVYGCGFYHVNSDYKPVLDRLAPADRETWVRNFDPSVYLPRLKAPVFWVSGATDGFPLDSWTKSHRLTASTLTVLKLLPRWPHGYQPTWNAPEPRVFADQITRGKTALLRVEAARRDGDKVTATYSGKAEPAFADLVYTTDRGRWQLRGWNLRPARLDREKGVIEADLPPDTTACFLNLTDKRALVTSSDCLFLVETPPETLAAAAAK